MIVDVSQSYFLNMVGAAQEEVQSARQRRFFDLTFASSCSSLAFEWERSILLPCFGSWCTGLKPTMNTIPESRLSCHLRFGEPVRNGCQDFVGGRRRCLFGPSI
jgi:hypothetical protein